MCTLQTISQGLGYVYTLQRIVQACNLYLLLFIDKHSKAVNTPQLDNHKKAQSQVTVGKCVNIAIQSTTILHSYDNHSCEQTMYTQL